MTAYDEIKEKARMLGLQAQSLRVGNAKPMIWLNSERTGAHVKSLRGFDKALEWLDEQEATGETKAALYELQVLGSV